MTEAALPRSQAGAAQPAPAVPDRPALAPGVELRGEMTETAYKQPPWLIERHGAYIPVSRLLHTVAEECSGRQTLAEIADAVSDKIQRRVTADDMTVIVGNLVQSGLVAGPDGAVVEAAAAAPPSPLAVNMRMKMLNPGFIDVLSRILQVLFWPPVVLFVLGAGALAQAWVYFIHGIGGSLHDALYAPGFVLLVLAAIVVAAGFHEFGHAAALRYAGGRAKAMGAGFYLFYPAFYTDVTDNYRLGRWSRLRTDLGGFYFHLIFALITIGAYLLTGWEPLLLIVVLINLEVIHQLLPFVRLDGYWALADLTGIPDFFSHMGPFIRSILPLPFLKRGTMPELKLWAKVVFVLYILVTIPILLFVLIHLVVGVPRVLATAWDSLGQLWNGMQGAIAQGDGLTVAGSIVQILVLGLMTGGLLFFLLTLARTALQKVWGWSRPTLPRRFAGVVGTLATIALLVFLFAPATPLTGDQGGPLSGNFAPIREDEPLTLWDMSRQALGGHRSASDGSVIEPSGGAGSPTAPTPTPGASATPTATPAPVSSATATPTATAQPTSIPSATPSPSPTPTPTPAPSVSPTPSPTLAPAP
jgi:putative peptide zinc metalloprotease protein